MASIALQRPAAMAIAEKVTEENSSGHYDDNTKTWSNRNYDLAATKKKNEDR